MRRNPPAAVCREYSGSKHKFLLYVFSTPTSTFFSKASRICSFFGILPSQFLYSQPFLDYGNHLRGKRKLYASGRPSGAKPSALYSHSMVPGGLLVMSYTTRLTPSTSLTMRFEIRDKSLDSAGNQSAVIPSTLWTRRMTTTL